MLHCHLFPFALFCHPLNKREDYYTNLLKQGDVLFSLAMKEQATKYKKGTKLPDFQVLSLSQTKSSQVCNSQ